MIEPNTQIWQILSEWRSSLQYSGDHGGDIVTTADYNRLVSEIEKLLTNDLNSRPQIRVESFAVLGRKSECELWINQMIADGYRLLGICPHRDNICVTMILDQQKKSRDMAALAAAIGSSKVSAYSSMSVEKVLQIIEEAPLSRRYKTAFSDENIISWIRRAIKEAVQKEAANG